MPSKKLDDVLDLSQEIIHDFYSGNTTAWLPYLCQKSVWAAATGPILFGADHIQGHLHKIAPATGIEIQQEDYFLIPVGAKAAAVLAQVDAAPGMPPYHIHSTYTLLYQASAKGLRLLLVHVGNEAAQSLCPEKTSPYSLPFLRDLLPAASGSRRIAVPCLNQTLYLDPCTILYAKSNKAKTELHCLDKVMTCSIGINELTAQLPGHFYPIHRCYTINTHYLTAIRRYEAELMTGEKLPIPALTYMQAKKDLERLMNV